MAGEPHAEGSASEASVGGATLFLCTRIHLFMYLFLNVYNEPVSLKGVVRDPETKVPLPLRRLEPNIGGTGVC